MEPLPPSIPFRLSKAYGVAPPSVRPVAEAATPSAPEARARGVRDTADLEGARRRERIDRLVAARVPGGIDFDAETPQPSAPARPASPARAETAIPFYRHPADRNAAAVNVHAGRILDVSG